MRQRLPLLAASVGIVLVLVSSLAWRSARKPPIERAVAVLADDGRFTTAEAAAEAVAVASAHVLEDAQRCEGAAAGDDARCAARFEAAGYLQVLIVPMLRCTAPRRFDIRAAARTYLDDVRTSTRSDRRPQPPDTASCD